MCYICNHSPHHSDCPFYENASLTKCSVCDSSIYKGQQAIKLNNELFHYECIKELSGIDVLEILEIEPQNV